MGYRIPNIDRIAREGALFTDWYGQPMSSPQRIRMLGFFAAITLPFAHRRSKPDRGGCL
jgi:hypothetical protein